MFQPRVSVARVGRNSSSVPLSVYESSLGIDQRVGTRPLPTAQLPRGRGDLVVDRAELRLGFGATATLWEGRLAVGAVVGLPALGGEQPNVATRYADEREAAFSNRVWPLRLGGWQRVADAIFGAAVQATPWLSLGVAGQIEATAVARMGVYVPDASVQDEVNTSMTASIETSLRPIVGARARWGGVSLGAVFRGESYFSVDAASEVTLWNYHDATRPTTQLRRSTQRIPVVFGYRPLEVALALGADLGGSSLELTATFQRWSRFLDAHGERPEEAARFPAGYEGRSSFDPSAFRFRDVVGVAAGGWWKASKVIQLGAGVSYQPTPVPAQVGRTSYADSDLLGVTFGQRVALGAWAVDLAAQLWHQAERTTYKDPARVVDEVPDDVRSLKENRAMPEMEGLQTNNPGFPGFRIRGALLAGSLFLTRTF